jgi:stage II sporulation protein D
MPSRISTLLIALVLTSAVLTASPMSAAADEDRDVRRAAIDSVTVKGRGYGHGHGLSQYGAQRAALLGRSYRQIVGFYYPGTRWSTAGGKVKVLITADTSADVVVGPRSGLKVKSLVKKKTWNVGKARPKAKRWRIKPVSGGRTKVQFKTSGWRTFRTFRGDAEFTAGRKPIRLYLPNGSMQYRGKLRSTRRDTVNVVPLDSYLKGVIPTEVFPSWHPHALRAQAVAARTYAAFERAAAPRSRHYQICDTTACQVYRGYSAEVSTTNAAVDATRRQILTYGGKAAFTQFSASNGGWTSAGSFPYLPAKADPYDSWAGNPYRSWTVTIKAAAIEKAFPAIGDLQSVEVLTRDGNGMWGGRATSVQLSGAKTSTTISGDTFRSIFGLRSTYFTVS